jgi:tetratricopeptide (TPR) repeat protein
LDAAVALNPARRPVVDSLSAVLIFALAASIFWPIRDHQWLNWDDFVYIRDNPYITLGFSGDGVRWAFSNFYLANWYPLTWLSWMVDYEVHGLDPRAFLTTNLLLHALASALLFIALNRLSGSRYRSAFVAAVFAVHPLHVESVAWASARKDVLSGVFWMLALYFYSYQPSKLRSALLVICYGLGFAAKPTIISLPFVLLLLDDWPLHRTRSDRTLESWDAERIRAVLVEKWPLFALLLLFGAIAFAAQHSEGTVQGFDALSPSMRIKNALIGFLAYVELAFLPRNLAAFYPHPGDTIPWWKAGLAGATLLGITSYTVARARTRPQLAVGWLWYLVTLLPVSGLIQIGAQARADRYMYLPLIGLTLIVAWGVPELGGSGRNRRLAVGVAAIAGIAALALQTTRQIPYWRDSEAVMEHALAVTRNNHVAHAHLGGAYLVRGRSAEAIEQYEAALRISPDYLSVANNLAWLLATSREETLRDPDRAIALADLAVRLSNRSDPAILDTLAAALASQGRFGMAIETASSAISLAQRVGNAELVAGLEQRLELYRESRPYRALGD